MSEHVGTLAEAMSRVPDGSRVFIGSATGVPDALVRELVAGDRHRTLHLVAGYLLRAVPLEREGISVTSLQPSSALWRSAAGAAIAPVRYSDYEAVFKRGALLDLDVALVQVSRPGPGGLYSLGTSVGGAYAAVRDARLVIAQVNGSMPYTFGDGELPESCFDVLIRHDEPLIDVAGKHARPHESRIADRVLGLVPDGAEVQLGVGSLPQLIGERLSEVVGLRVRSGMISDWARVLGAPGPASIVTAEVVGTTALYEWVDSNPLVRTVAAARSHLADAAGPFVAINSVLELDLRGAVNAEVAGGHILSGPGGLPDFVGIALRSRGGRSIITLNSTSPDGAASSIVPAIPDTHAVTLPASMADAFVTEHGVAEVRYADAATRAELIGAIAAPEYRAGLTS